MPGRERNTGTHAVIEQIIKGENTLLTIFGMVIVLMTE
jgi:hypothetical protein